MDSAGVYSKNGKGCGFNNRCSPTYPVQGICPEGWHLPDTAEWKTLYKTIGQDPFAMQARGYENWKKATNISNFSALPGGYDSHEGFDGDGEKAGFWSSTEYNNLLAYHWDLDTNEASLTIFDGKFFGRTVRCVKDELINDSLRLKKQKEYLCSRSTASIMDVVRKNAPNLRKIYDGMLKKEKEFQGKIKIKFSIDDYSGNVVETAIVSSTTGNDLFDEKIKDAVSLWNFGKLQCSVSSQGREVEPIQHGRKTVTIPFDFQE